MADRQIDEKAIFNGARQIAGPEERLAYLQPACGHDPAAMHRIMELLRVYEQQGSFLESSPLARPATIELIAERPGTVIGSYKLLEQIGEGGFGFVFMAEQTEPVRRKVALKVLKPGMDTRQVVARFEAERQALALMDHPNIARVLDGGQTASGRPFFVMDLVKGLPITDYCDQAQLETGERLKLFVDLCRAVQHAHQKGVIHRDLKPSNVLVTVHDTTPVVKVIDFGVAKALGQELTDKTLFTGFAQMVGTPLYMSPEQAGQSGLDVDTRSDIYSLGVLLYELLTGTTPFDKNRLKEVGYDEMRRIIREEDPPKPSTRISTLARAATTLATQRKSDPRRLSQLFRGELDWIVMKALEKDRSRRYETANSLALDVQRCLADEPVQACPPSVGYRLRKFTRRHQAVVIAASLVLLALAAGFIGTAWEMVRATAAEQDTAAALAAAQKSERAKTEQLWEALVAEARATRLSRRPGQRFNSLEILKLATPLARALDLPQTKLHHQRNAAIAALAVPDLCLTGPWNPWPADAYGFDFDENHTLYARTDRQGACSIRRVADDVEIHRLPGEGRPAHPHLSRDGKFIALTMIDREGKTGLCVKLWRLEPTPRLLLSEAGARCVDYHPRAPQIALGYHGGKISVFELPSGRRLAPLAPEGLRQEITIALHPIEPLVAVCSYFGSAVELRDVHTGKLLTRLPQGRRAQSLAWHPDGRTLAVGMAEAAQVRLYDLATRRLFRTFDTGGTVTQVAFNHAGDRLAATGWSQQVELFDVGTGQKLFATPAVSWCRLRFSRDGQRLGGAVQNGKLGIWQVGDSREYRTLAHNRSPQTTALNPDGRLLAAGTNSGFGLWDLATGSELTFIPSPGHGLHQLVFEPSGSLLVLGPSGLFRWPIPKDVAMGPAVIGPPVPLPLPRGSTLDQSRDGQVIVTCCRAVVGQHEHAGGWILHADRPGRPIHIDPGADIVFIAVSPDGKWVITTTHWQPATKVWDARDGKLIKDLGERAGYPQFSRDGRWLSTSQDGGRLLAVGTWELGPKVAAGVFTPDSKLVATSTTAGIRLIDHAHGREVAMLEAPDLDPGVRILFTPDGTKMIVLSKGIHVWDLRLIRGRLKEMGLDWEWPEFAADERIVPPGAGPAVVPVLGAANSASADDSDLRSDLGKAVLPPQANPSEDMVAAYRIASYQNGLAWVLATSPQPKLRDARKAVELAEEAVARVPKAAGFWNTLGVARYRNGDWKAAIAALTKSTELQGENAHDSFFQAMARWQLGEKEEARRWHDSAVAWMEANRPADEELRRFRAESTELMKVGQRKD